MSDQKDTRNAVSAVSARDAASAAGAGIAELSELLRHMAPVLDDTDYVFCTVQGEYSDYAHLKPLCSFVESEGLTLVVDTASATKAQIPFDGSYKRITLTVHSSLEAVGLTAAVSAALTDVGISANVVAAYFHDHVFVQARHAQKAMEALHQLAAKHQP